MDSSVVKLTGNQTIQDVKTFTSHLTVPAKSTLPSSPLTTQYATEAQVGTRIVRPAQATLDNIAIFDNNRNVVDSGIAYTAIDLIAITNQQIDTLALEYLGV